MGPVPGAILTQSLELYQGRVNSTHLIDPRKNSKFRAPAEIPSYPVFPTKRTGTARSFASVRPRRLQSRFTACSVPVEKSSARSVAEVGVIDVSCKYVVHGHRLCPQCPSVCAYAARSGALSFSARACEPKPLLGFGARGVLGSAAGEGDGGTARAALSAPPLRCGEVLR